MSAARGVVSAEPADASGAPAARRFGCLSSPRWHRGNLAPPDDVRRGVNDGRSPDEGRDSVAYGRMRGAVVGIVAAVALSACGCRTVDQPRSSAGTATDGPDGSAAVSTAEVPTFVEPECDDSGDCAAGFLLADTFYSLSCGAVRPDAVTEEKVARGELSGQDVDVRSVEGVSTDVLVAVSVVGGVCDVDDVPLSPWRMAFGEHASQSEQEAAVCTVVVEEQRARNDCG